MRGADRDVEGSVGVAQGTGEDVSGPQISARGEPRDLHLSRAVAGLSSCGDCVVSTRGLAHCAAGGLGRARVQGSGLLSSTKHWFTRPSAAQARADRVNVLLGFHHSTVMRVQAPHPLVINLGAPKFLQSRESLPRALLLEHLEQV